MADNVLGLNSQHEEYIIDYLRFSKSKRSQCLDAIQASFADLADSRLVETTLTNDEVREMLDSLCGVLRADVDSDLINSAHTNALLLRQLFQQAEKWHLKLQANIAEIEDKELLDQVAQLERTQLSSSSRSLVPRRGPTQLEPLNSIGGDMLLQGEIKRLEEENKTLREKVKKVEAKVSSTLAEKDELKSSLVEHTSSSHFEDEVVSLREQVSRLSEALSQASVSPVQPKKDNGGSSEELTVLSQEVLRLKAELEHTNKELEAKFNSTAQYQNMKKMLASKNTTIADLRTKLSQYQS